MFEQLPGFTGKGHGTDRAVILGLAGEKPQTMDPDRVDEVLRQMAERGSVIIAPDHSVAFNPARDVIFDFGPALKGHANGMVFRILDDDNNTLLSETYYSIGGGFVQTEAGRRSTGFGLGLAYCRTAVTAHGGTIRAEEGPGGVGTRIVFSLPLNPSVD